MRPSPVVVNAKSCAPFGNASFTIVNVAWLCVLVNVQVTSAPATQIDRGGRSREVDGPARRARQAGERPARQAQALDHAVLAREQVPERLAVGQARVRVIIEHELCRTT